MPTFAGELVNAAVGVASLDDTALRGSYQVVTDIAARNAIAGSDFDKTGMRVFVQSSGELWQRTASSWKFLQGATIDSLLNVDFLERIYISSSGDDIDNDGSSGSPFATPQRASQKIGNGSKGYFFIIPLDDGPFPAPGVVECEPDNQQETFICFTGRLDVQDTTIPSPGVAALAPGKSTQYDVTTAGYTATIGRGTHWFADGFTAVEEYNILFGFFGLSINGAASPTMRAVTQTGGVLATASAIPVRPISTVYTTNGDDTYIGARSRAAKVVFAGLKFADASGSLIRIDPNVDFRACDLSGLTSSTLPHAGNAFVANCVVNQTRPPEQFTGFTVGGILTGMSPSDSGYIAEATMTAQAPLAQKIFVQNPAIRMTMGNIDFEGDTTYNVRVQEGSHVFNVFGDHTTSGIVATHFQADSDSGCGIDMLGGSSVTGSVTSGFKFDGASHAKGLAAACSGSLTASGSDVTIGNAGGFTYAALPQNDFTAVTGRGTVVES